VGGLRQYAIPFRGLKEGKHYYEFIADNSFFEQFDFSEVKKGLVKINVELIKHSQFLELHFSLNGRVMVHPTGIPMVTPGQTLRGGSGAPDWTGGLSTSFSWKGINLSALIDVRMGGVVFSFTEANLTSDGFSERTLYGREGFVVDGLKDAQDYDANPDGDPIWVENDIEVTAEAYWLALGGRNDPTGEPYGYDASFVRLREVQLGYTFNLTSNVIQSIDVALYGRNLGFLYNASEVIDPGMSMSVGNIQGVEGFGLPTSRTFGLNARFKF